MATRARMSVERFVKIAKALADPTRRRMVDEIREASELTCSCLCAKFETSQPTISHHIRTLADAGVIDVRKEGPYHILTLRDGTLREFTDSLAPATSVARRPAKK